MIGKSTKKVRWFQVIEEGHRFNNDDSTILKRDEGEDFVTQQAGKRRLRGGYGDLFFFALLVDMYSLLPPSDVANRGVP